MKYTFAHILTTLIPLAVGLYIGSHFYHVSPTYKIPRKAVAVLRPTEGNNVTGIVHFEPGENGLHIYAECQNLTPGLHGFHIHESGDCGCPDAKCAGDHYNPRRQPHGSPTSAQRHLGDLGNIEADKDGNATLEIVDQHLQLAGPESIIGRSIIIHADADDVTSQPTGNAGEKVAIGAIGALY